MSPKFAASSKTGGFAGALENRLALSVIVTAFVLVSIMAANILTANTSKPRVTSPKVIAAQAGQPINSSANQATQAQIKPMNQTPANQIDPSTIDRIAGNAPSNIIMFKDGSSMALDAYTLEQLPAEVRLHITYSQGPSRPQPAEVRRPGGPNAR